MVVGDAVNGYSVAAANFDFQPAGTNVFILTSYGVWANGAGYTNGVTFCYCRTGVDNTPTTTDTKLVINNTNYLRCLVGTGGMNGLHQVYWSLS